ncbi:polyprotein [Frankliniella fusca]|uniref:Polyprotein n=1 Tax=Frankliniella fusca TaxID=407009 RepID=A0AAE1H0D6_9NEOP|nr:polyprotein [Frankliniella fusca]
MHKTSTLEYRQARQDAMVALPLLPVVNFGVNDTEIFELTSISSNASIWLNSGESDSTATVYSQPMTFTEAYVTKDEQ